MTQLPAPPHLVLHAIRHHRRRLPRSDRELRRAGEFGLFTAPISEAHAWPREYFSFAMALQNLVWDLRHPSPEHLPTVMDRPAC